MSPSPGTRLGPYEIVSPLWAGGMGEVCRARDGQRFLLRETPGVASEDEPLYVVKNWTSLGPR